MGSIASLLFQSTIVILSNSANSEEWFVFFFLIPQLSLLSTNNGIRTKIRLSSNLTEEGRWYLLTALCKKYFLLLRSTKFWNKNVDYTNMVIFGKKYVGFSLKTLKNLSNMRTEKKTLLIIIKIKIEKSQSECRWICMSFWPMFLS